MFKKTGDPIKTENPKSFQIVGREVLDNKMDGKATEAMSEIRHTEKDCNSIISSKRKI